MKESSGAENHHWFPQCIMRPWKGNDGLVEVFYTSYNGVKSRRRSTKAVGATYNLYRINAEWINNQLIFEESFSKFENLFVRSRSRIIEDGIKSINAKDRENFAFMLAMMHIRTPVFLGKKIKQAQADWDKEIASMPRSPQNSEDEHTQLSKIARQGFGNYITLLTSFSFGQNIAQEIMSLDWRLIDFQNSQLKLVIGDSPLKIELKDDIISFFSIPITPNHLFVAGNRKSYQEVEYNDEFRKILAISENRRQFQQANGFVVGQYRDPYFLLAEKYLSSRL